MLNVPKLAPFSPGPTRNSGNAERGMPCDFVQFVDAGAARVPGNASGVSRGGGDESRPSGQRRSAATPQNAAPCRASACGGDDAPGPAQRPARGSAGAGQPRDLPDPHPPVTGHAAATGSPDRGEGSATRAARSVVEARLDARHRVDAARAIDGNTGRAIDHASGVSDRDSAQAERGAADAVQDVAFFDLSEARWSGGRDSRGAVAARGAVAQAASQQRPATADGLQAGHPDPAGLAPTPGDDTSGQAVARAMSLADGKAGAPAAQAADAARASGTDTPGVALARGVRQAAAGAGGSAARWTVAEGAGRRTALRGTEALASPAAPAQAGRAAPGHSSPTGPVSIVGNAGPFAAPSPAAAAMTEAAGTRHGTLSRSEGEGLAPPVPDAARPEASPPARAQSLPAPVAMQITRALQEADQRVVQLQLAPAELGRVRITLSAQDAGLHVLIISERPETLDLLRRNADELFVALSALGYEGLDLSFGREGREGQEARADHRPPQDAAAAAPPPEARAPAAPRGAAGAGLDLRW